MIIGLYSLGLLSGSIAKAIKLKNKEISIYAFSRENTIKKAKEINLCDKYFLYDELENNIEEIDILILCSPITIVEETIKKISNFKKLNKKVIITDIGSTKEKITQTAQKYLNNRNDIVFVGGHPMAGNEFSGIEHSEPYLFENAFYIITPTQNSSENDIKQIVDLTLLLGANPLILDSSIHDKIASIVSHFPQILASSLVGYVATIDNNQNIKKLAAGGFRDMTRIASSQYTIWRDIINSNRENIVSIISGFIDYFNNILNDIKQKKDLDNLFDLASKYRDTIPVDTRGFINKIWYLTIRVPDESGVLYKLTKILYEHNINIKDFSVVKIREQISGSIKLGFNSLNDRDLAKVILKEQKYEVMVD